MRSDLKFKVLSYVMDGGRTGNDIMNNLGITRNQFYKVKEELRTKGLQLNYDPSSRVYSVRNTSILTPEELEVVRRIGKLGLQRKQIDGVLTTLSVKRIPKEYREVTFGKDKLVFVIVSDMHAGSKYYRGDVIRRAAEEAKIINADFVLNAGDSIDGISGRDGQFYELSTDGIGTTAQAEFLAQELIQFGDIPVYSIEAQGSHGGWAWSSHKGAIGLNVGEYLETTSLLRKDEVTGRMVTREGGGQYKFIGFNQADITIDGIVFRMIHFNKGTLKGYINGLTGSNKPHVVISGHFHSRVNYEFVRNVHAINAGTAQETTNFLERNASESILGYHVCEAVIGHGPTDQTELNGPFIESLSVRFVPFYSKGVI